MAAGDIIWAEGFESGSVAMHAGSYTIDPSYSRVANSGAGVRFASQDGGTTYYRKDFFANYEEIIFGFAFQTAGWVYSNRISNLISFHDGSTWHCGLYMTTYGALVFALKSLSTVTTNYAVAKPASLTLNTWHWIDGKIRFNNTNGNFEFRQNGIVIASGYNIDTCLSANQYTYGFSLNASDTDNNWNTYFDDVYIMDNTGGTQNYLGDIRVYDIVPSGDGFHTGLTPLTGTSHYEMVDDGITVNDADYLYTTVSGVMDTFLYNPLLTPASNITAIHGVIHANRVRKVDASTKTIRVVQRTDGVTYERSGSDANLTNTFNYYFYPETVNPVTTSGWTPQEVNAIELGIKVEV
jgi:hypothetical protein